MVRWLTIWWWKRKLRSTNAATRARAIGALANVRAVAALATGLSGPDATQIIDALGLVKDPSAIEPLLGAVTTAPDLVIRTLDQIDPGWVNSVATRTAVPQFLASLARNPTLALRDTLDRIEPEWAKSPAARTVIPGLLLVLAARSGGSLEWKGLVALLYRIDLKWMTWDEARHAVPAILQALASDPPAIWIYDWVQKALDLIPDWHALPTARAAIPTLVVALARMELQTVDLSYRDWTWKEQKDWNRKLRECLRAVLKQIGPKWRRASEAAEAVPSLIPSVLATSNNIAESAAVACILGEIAPDWGSHPTVQAAVPALLAAVLDDPGNESSKKSRWLLNQIAPEWHRSPQALDARPGLIARLLDAIDERGSGATEVMEVLDRIGPDWVNSDAVQAGVPRLVSKVYSLWAALILGRRADPRAVTTLARYLIWNDARTREQALAALRCYRDPMIIQGAIEQVRKWPHPVREKYHSEDPDREDHIEVNYREAVEGQKRARQRLRELHQALLAELASHNDPRQKLDE